MPGPVAARKRSFARHGHGAVKTAPYKAVFYSILSKSGIKISMF